MDKMPRFPVFCLCMALGIILGGCRQKPARSLSSTDGHEESLFGFWRKASPPTGSVRGETRRRELEGRAISTTRSRMSELLDPPRRSSSVRGMVRERENERRGILESYRSSLPSGSLKSEVASIMSGYANVIDPLFEGYSPPLSMEEVKQMCQALLASDACSRVPAEHMRRCDDIGRQTEMEYTRQQLAGIGSGLWSVTKGTATSLWNGAIGLWKWAVGTSTEEKLSDANEAKLALQRKALHTTVRLSSLYDKIRSNNPDGTDTVTLSLITDKAYSVGTSVADAVLHSADDYNCYSVRGRAAYFSYALGSDYVSEEQRLSRIVGTFALSRPGMVFIGQDSPLLGDFPEIAQTGGALAPGETVKDENGHAIEGAQSYAQGFWISSASLLGLQQEIIEAKSDFYEKMYRIRQWDDSEEVATQRRQMLEALGDYEDQLRGNQAQEIESLEKMQKKESKIYQIKDTASKLENIRRTGYDTFTQGRKEDTIKTVFGTEFYRNLGYDPLTSFQQNYLDDPKYSLSYDAEFDEHTNAHIQRLEKTILSHADAIESNNADLEGKTRSLFEASGRLVELQAQAYDELVGATDFASIPPGHLDFDQMREDINFFERLEEEGEDG